jgi:hypothetical protein
MPIQPDISAQPIELKIECTISVPPGVIYEAWPKVFEHLDSCLSNDA